MRTRANGLLKHGHALAGKRTKTYEIWKRMKQRCKYEHHYADRGIYVCEQWLKFENFLADMGVKPKGLTLDRINNDGPYSPENCRWASTGAQSRNRRNTRLITFNGRTMCITDWAYELGLKPNTLTLRFLHGWPIERALKSELERIQK